MPTLTAPLGDLQKALNTVATHLDDDGWTPVLECVNVVNDDDGVALLATDRYTAIEYRMDGLEVANPEEIRGGEAFLFPAALVDHLRSYGVTRNVDDEDLAPTYAADGWTVSITMVDADPADLSTGSLIVTVTDPSDVEWSRQRFAAVRMSPPDIRALFPEVMKPLSTFVTAFGVLKRITSTASVLHDLHGPVEIAISTGQKVERKPVIQIEFAPAPVRVLFGFAERPVD